MRSGAAHAHGAPVVLDRHTGGGKRKSEMQDRGFRSGCRIYSRGHEQVTDRTTTREDLPRGDPPTILDADCDPGAIEPIRRAAGHELQPLIGHAPQNAFDRRRVTPPAPDQCRQGMRVHGQRERGRTTVPPQDPQHLAKLGIGCAAAAKLRRHAGREHATRLEFHEILSDERVIGVASIRSFGEARPQRVHQSGPGPLSAPDPCPAA